jgi:hypothetical protein
VTITAIKPGGWNLEDLLTSDEMNALQAALLKAIDGVDGGSYTLGGTLSLGGALVRITYGLEIDGCALVVDADATLQIAGAVTQTGNTALTGNIEVNALGDININTGGNFSVKNNGFFTVANNGNVTWLNGAELEVHATAVVDLDSTFITLNGAMSVTDGAVIDLEGGATGARMNVLAGAKVLGADGAEMQVWAAEDLTINASSFVWRSTMSPTYVDPAWGPRVDGTPTWCMLNTAVAGRPLIIPLPLMPGDTLTTVRVTLTGQGSGGAGHGGNLPAVMPRAQLISVSSLGVATVIKDVADGISAGSYDTSHPITLSGGLLPYTVGTDPLYVRVICESGANAVNNTTLVTMIDGTGVARSFRGQNEIL